MDTSRMEDLLALTQLRSLEPGEHMEHLEAKLRARMGRPRSRSRKPWAVAGMVTVGVAGIVAASMPFLSRLTQGVTVTWTESGGFIALDQVAPQHRAELANLWERGEGVLLERVDGRATTYRIQFTFSDGHTQTVAAAAPLDPAKRRELKQLIASGRGEVAETVRGKEFGMFLTYFNRYTLADGERITTNSQFPPLSDRDRENAKSFIAEQMLRRGGVVVGELKGASILEYQLPDGRPFTSVEPPPSASLTPEREQEIFALQAEGKGRLVQRYITAEALAYIVEYQLSDGSLFRIGQTRPPMPETAARNMSKEIVLRITQGLYVEETIMGTDGRPVDVFTVNLDDGETFQLPKALRAHLNEGLVQP